MTKTYCLAMSGVHHRMAMSHLFPGDGKEAVVLALCGKTKYGSRVSFLVQSIIPVSYDACRVRKSDCVTWSPESIIPALTLAMNQGLHVVKMHSHPSGHPSFSKADDQSDTEFFSSVFGWLDTEEPQASVVMLPTGEMFGRTIFPNFLGEEIDEFRITGDDLKIWRRTSMPRASHDFSQRITQAFGEKTYNLLRNMKIGVVGCSGTGSIVIEQLARNCVGRLVLVDPDRVEEKNLNRILNSTWEDAELGRYKVAVMQRAISSMGLGTEVTALNVDLKNRDAIHHLSSCDALIGCMDSIDGRHILNKLASYYVIPLIDVGVRIDADGKGGIEQICAAVHYIQPGGSSLLSRGVYTQKDLDSAFLIRENPEQYSALLKEGYVRNARVNQPAVVSINMQAAALAVNELLARIHPYRIESNREYAHRCIVLSDPPASIDCREEDACPVFANWVGRGDFEPPLGLQP